MAAPTTTNEALYDGVSVNGPSRWERNTASQLRHLASMWHNDCYDGEEDTVEYYKNIIINGVEEAAKHGKYSYRYDFEYVIDKPLATGIKTTLRAYLPDCLIRIVLQKELELDNPKKWEFVGTYIYVDWSQDLLTAEEAEEKWNDSAYRTKEQRRKDGQY